MQVVVDRLWSQSRHSCAGAGNVHRGEADRHVSAVACVAGGACRRTVGRHQRDALFDVDVADEVRAGQAAQCLLGATLERVADVRSVRHRCAIKRDDIAGH